MINLVKGHRLMTGVEVLDNIAKYIKNYVGAQDWDSHIDDISGYLSAGIEWSEDEVSGYLKSRIIS